MNFTVCGERRLTGDGEACVCGVVAGQVCAILEVQAGDRVKWQGCVFSGAVEAGFADGLAGLKEASGASGF